MSAPPPSNNALANYVIAFASRVASVTASKTLTAPLRRASLLLEIQGEHAISGRVTKPNYGVFSLIQQLVKEGGITSLWKGNVMNIACGTAPFLSAPIVFLFNKQLPRVPRDSTYPTKFIGNVALGAAAGCFSILLTGHMNYVQQRLAADMMDASGAYQFSGIMDVYRQTWNSDGILGFYRGFSASCIGVIVYRVAYFGLYDSLKLLFVKRRQPSMFVSFLLGFSVTILAGVISYPLQTIAARMAMRSIEAVPYKSWIHCGRQIVKTEGVSALFRGAGVHTFLAISSASALVVWDQIRAGLFN